MGNDNFLDEEGIYPDFDNHSWEIERQEKYYLFTKKVYYHPYFTYHIEPPEHYKPDHYVSGFEVWPFSIPIRTISDGDSQVYPKDINEESIKNGFCFYIKRHESAEIPLFLNYQYEQYIKSCVPNPVPERFLDYIITTIDNFKHPYQPNWVAENFWSLSAVATWIRNHPNYINSFDLRLKNWINIGVGFREVFENHKNYYFQKFYSFIYSNGPKEIPGKLDQDFRISLDNLKPGDNPLSFFLGLLGQLKKFLPLNYKMMDSTFLSLRAVGEWINSHPGSNEDIKKSAEQWLAKIGTYESFVVEKGRTKLHPGEQNITGSQQTISRPLADIITDNNAELVADKLKHLKGSWRSKKIISEEDYQRLVGYVNFLIKDDKLPANIIPIKTNFPIGHIRATFVDLYYATVHKISKKDLWVDLLCAVFPTKFSENTNKKSTLIKFAPTQDPASFKKDVANILKNLGRE